jgi:hypothetical protein
MAHLLATFGQFERRLIGRRRGARSEEGEWRQARPPLKPNHRCPLKWGNPSARFLVPLVVRR